MASDIMKTVVVALLLVALLFGGPLGMSAALAEDTIQLGSRRELMIDGYLI